MPYQKLIKNTNIVPSREKKKPSLQISVYNPATGCKDDAAIGSELSWVPGGRGDTAVESWGPPHLPLGPYHKTRG